MGVVRQVLQATALDVSAVPASVTNPHLGRFSIRVQNERGAGLYYGIYRGADAGGRMPEGDEAQLFEI